MKLGLTAKALALAVAVGVSSQAMANTTNGWWNIDFEGATMVTLTNEATFAGIGEWTTSEDDESTIETDNTNYLKLDTQGTDLTWTPSFASTTSVVLVNADIYLVGSDSEPTGFDTDTGNPVQTAVYLKNYVDDDTSETTNSVLCAYVADGESDNKWVELTGFTMTDTNWYAIKIEVDYTPQFPVARFYVDNTQMFDDTGDSFTIANYTNFGSEILHKVNSVSFRGTGAVDNFVGEQIIPAAAADLTFTVKSFTDNVEDASFNGAIVPGVTVSPGTNLEIRFPESDLLGQGENFLTVVRVYTNATQYVDYNATRIGEGDWTLDDPLTFDSEGFQINLVVDTTGLTEGYTIKAYYGAAPLPDDPEPVDPTAPAIGGGDIGTAEPVAFETIGEDEYFVVTFAAPETGVEYTLQTAAALGDAFVDSTDALATATSTEVDEVITLKAPTGGATKMFFRIKAAPAPAS